MAGRSPGIRVLETLGSAGGSGNAQHGTAAIVYKTASSHSLEVSSEYICSRLAQALGMFTVVGEVGWTATHRRAWVSLTIDSDGDDSFAPPDRHDIASGYPDFAASVLVFDEWIANHDREEWNLAYSPTAGPFAMDFGDALADPGETLVEYQTSATQSHMFHGLVGANRQDAWVSRINMLSRSAILAPIRQARDLGLLSDSDATATLKLLEKRRGMLQALLAGTNEGPPPEQGTLG